VAYRRLVVRRPRLLAAKPAFLEKQFKELVPCFQSEAIPPNPPYEMHSVNSIISGDLVFRLV
jgi:hypothetical protein